MKKKLLPLTILLIAGISTMQLNAQSKKYFAVTGAHYGDVNWMVFRQMDLSSSVPVKTVYIPAESNEAVYDAASGEKIMPVSSTAIPAQSAKTCSCLTGRMVAAIAYDAATNRLYYTPMLGNQLRYLDLSTSQPKSYAVTTQLLKNFNNQPGEASVITRMCIASTGFGYALTNDNQHLIKFSTGKQTSITDLGNLTDAKSNGENSVNVQFKSWGGDMIADASGNLYLFAMERGVYKINPDTRLATFIGQITGLPEDFTVNAAMVENNASAIVGTSVNTDSYYRVDLTTLQAKAVSKNTDQVYNVSDFANANFAFSNKSSVQNNAVAATFAKNMVTIYPNPVINHNLAVQFSNFLSGKYIVQVSEMQGKTILKKEISVSGSQIEHILFPVSITSGTYLLQVINSKGESIYSGNVIID